MARFSEETGKRIIRGIKKIERYTEPPNNYGVVRSLGGNERIIARAGIESGSYPTLQGWSEASATAQQKVWQFQLGTVTYDEDVVTSQTTFTAFSPARWVKVQNSTGHYVPTGMLCFLEQIDGKYYTDYTMPLYVTGAADAIISQGSNGLITVLTAAGMTGKIRGYDRFLGTGQTIAASKVVGCSLRQYHETGTGKYYWRYDITERVC